MKMTLNATSELSLACVAAFFLGGNRELERTAAILDARTKEKLSLCFACSTWRPFLRDNGFPISPSQKTAVTLAG